MERLLLRPEEMAEVLGIGRTRAYQMLARCEVPGVVRIGRSVRISARALEEWIAQQAQPAAAGGAER